MFKPKSNFTELKRLENFFTDGKVQLTSNGEYVLCCQHHTINLLHLQTGVIHHSFSHEDKSKISCFHLTSDNKYLFTANNEFLIRQWDFNERCIIKSWRSDHKAPVACMDSVVVDTLLCTGSSDGSARVFDYESKNVKHIFRKHSGVVSLVKFHPHHSNHLITSCSSYAIKLWDLNTNKCLKVLDGHFSLVTSVAFSKRDNLLYSSSRDKVVMIWSLDNYTSRTIAIFESIEEVILMEGGGRELRAVVEDHYQDDFQDDFQDDHLVVAGNKGKLSVWNAAKGVRVLPTTGASDDGYDEVVMDTDCLLQCVKGTAGHVVTVTAEQVISLHRLSDLSVVKQFSGNNDQILDIKFLKTPNNATTDHTDHLVVATNSHKLRLYNIHDWSCRLYDGHTEVIVAVATITNVDGGCYVATASKDNTVRVWKVSSNLTLTCVGVAQGHLHTVTCVAFIRLSSKNASGHMFIASGSNDKTIRIWKFSPSEDAEMGKVVMKLTVEAHSDDINHITTSPDSKLIATASRDKTAKLWDRSDLKMLGVFKGHKRGVWTVEFSPVNKVVATASADTTIKVWEITSFTCIKSLEQHQCSVLKAFFMSGEAQFISGDSSGCLKLWDTKSKTVDRSLDCHEDKMWALSLNQSQDKMVTGDAEGVLVYWSMVTKEEEELETAAKVKELKLKEQELDNLMQAGSFSAALALCISLDQPKKCLRIVTTLWEQKEDKLEKTLSTLSDTLIRSLLEYTVAWNRHHSNYVVCEGIHYHFMRTLSQEQFIALDNGQHLLDNLYLNSRKIHGKWRQLNIETTFISFLLTTINLTSTHLPQLSNGKTKKIEVIDVDDSDSSDDSD